MNKVKVSESKATVEN